MNLKNKSWNEFYESLGLYLSLADFNVSPLEYRDFASKLTLKQCFFEDVKLSAIETVVVVSEGVSLRLLYSFLRDKADCFEISPYLAESIVDASGIAKNTYVKILFAQKNYRAKKFFATDITLLEGLLFQAKYFFDKGIFYPAEKIICSGSLGFGDKIPVIYHKYKKLWVEFITPKDLPKIPGKIVRTL